MIDEPGHSTGHLSIPFERGDDHVEDNFRCVARSFRRCRTRHGGWFQQDHPGAGRKIGSRDSPRRPILGEMFGGSLGGHAGSSACAPSPNLP